MLSKKATKIDEIFTVDLTLCSKCQIDSEDFVNFCGLLRKHENCLDFFILKLNEPLQRLLLPSAKQNRPRMAELVILFVFE